MEDLVVAKVGPNPFKKDKYNAYVIINGERVFNVYEDTKKDAEAALEVFLIQLKNSIRKAYN